ncbi:hypothetical protein [Brevundimonas sp.]|uniref:hypothetical protein n=1 Tax=Brevundimonas sp. TaxID=1871086 RepID=UPI0025B7C4DE|nr:hypothetical protein [Brevundimonas sp.]MCG2665040.1 hypothetical protein [Brevundimonas sp.]
MRGHALQAAWEEWTIDWRIAVEMAEAYGRKNRLNEKALADLKLAREADPDLSYIWHSGNAERHNPAGSSSRTNAIALDAADRSKPVFVHSLHIQNGIILKNLTENGVWDFDAGEVVLHSINDRERRHPPPANATPHSLAVAGSAYLQRLRRLVFPQ